MERRRGKGQINHNIVLKKGAKITNPQYTAEQFNAFL
jgi:hypothetical protein